MKTRRAPGRSTSPGYQVWRVSLLWQRHMLQALSEFALTHVQYAVLSTCEAATRESGVVTQSQLAKAASLDEMMTSQVVRALERRGLLVRHTPGADHRSRELRLTPAGRQLVTAACQAVEQADVAVFEPLGSDVLALSSLLQTLTEYHKDSASRSHSAATGSA